MSRKHWIWAGAVVLGLVLLVGGGAYALRDQIAYARIATGYAAKQTCSCVHVGGRDIESCLGDFPTEAREQISVVRQDQTVRASVLFGAISAQARYEHGFGCVIAN